MYSSTCPIPVDASEYFPRVQELAEELEPYVAEFVTHTSARMERHESQVIGPLKRRKQFPNLLQRPIPHGALKVILYAVRQSREEIQPEGS